MYWLARGGTDRAHRKGLGSRFRDAVEAFRAVLRKWGVGAVRVNIDRIELKDKREGLKERCRGLRGVLHF